MSEVIFKTQNLTKKYGKHTAVNNLNLEIKKGEIFGLLGPNGAGKTTTILMLLGLTEPTSGQAFLKDFNCTTSPIQVKSITGYLPDNVGFYKDLTGRQNLAFTARLNHIPEKEINDTIDRLVRRVGIEDAVDNKVGTYSRGMRQRLGIADVLIKDPEVVILDEPTLGVDPEGIKELLDLIQDLSKNDGRTIILSSHHLHQVQKICDRVGMFVHGDLIAVGPIETLGREIMKGEDFILELSAEPCDGKMEQLIRETAGVVKVESDRGTYKITAREDIRKPLVKNLFEHGYLITYLRARGFDLDDIYSRFFANEANEGGKNLQ